MTITPAMAETRYGVAFTLIGEDGDLLALGHVDPRRALAAFNWYSRTTLGLTNYLDDRSADLDDALATITHTWFVFREPDAAEGDDTDWAWIAQEVAAHSAGAVPCTYARIA